MTITVYTGTACPACNFTKRALLNKRIAHNAQLITQEERERFAAGGHRSLPVVVVTNDADEKLDEWHGFRPDKINALEKPS